MRPTKVLVAGERPGFREIGSHARTLDWGCSRAPLPFRLRGLDQGLVRANWWMVRVKEDNYPAVRDALVKVSTSRPSLVLYPLDRLH